MSYVRRRLFHGDNTGSNPVGDANKSKTFKKATLRILLRLGSIKPPQPNPHAPSSYHTHNPMLSFALQFHDSPRISIASRPRYSN